MRKEGEAFDHEAFVVETRGGRPSIELSGDVRGRCSRRGPEGKRGCSRIAKPSRAREKTYQGGALGEPAGARTGRLLQKTPLLHRTMLENTPWHEPVGPSRRGSHFPKLREHSRDGMSLRWSRGSPSCRRTILAIGASEERSAWIRRGV